jgi:hypothetical protein
MTTFKYGIYKFYKFKGLTNDVLDLIRFDFFHGTKIGFRKPKMTPEKKKRKTFGF